MEKAKMNLHPEMNDELRSLILDLDGALNRLYEYAKEHDTQDNDQTDQANYFAYQFNCFYAESDNKLMLKRSRCINKQDFVQILKIELNELL